MFCPKCGNQLVDGASFCPKCGNPVNVAGRGGRVFKQSQAGSSTSLPKRVHTSKRGASSIRGAGSLGGVAAVKGKLPIVPIAIAAVTVMFAILLVGGLFSSGQSVRQSSVPLDQSALTESGGQLASSSTESMDSGLTEDDPSRISPKEKIEVSGLQVETDALNRYYITGTATNKSNQNYDVEISLAATEHASDKYGEETTKQVNFDFVTVTPFTEAQGSQLFLYDMDPGEARFFTLYPYWRSVEESYSDITAVIDEVSLPDTQSEWRYDHAGDIKITDLSYSADGKVVGKFENNSGMYLETVKFVVLPYNSDGLPMVKNSSGTRPCSTELYEGTAETLKPGDSGEFEIQVGEGHSKVEVVHVMYRPDREKSSWS